MVSEISSLLLLLYLYRTTTNAFTMAAPPTLPTTAATATATSMAPTTASSAAEAGAGFDVTLLRRVLRLVHCLQKERGASCAYYACRQAATNNGSTITDPDTTVISQKRLAVGSARRDTDKAFSLSTLRGKDKGASPVQKTLAKIRNMLPWNDTTEASSTAINNNSNAHPRTGLHRFLLCFNTLISSVIHEYILRRKTLWNVSASSLDHDDAGAFATTSLMVEKNQPLQHGAEIQHDSGSRSGSRSRSRGHSFDLQQVVPQSMPRIHSHNNLPYHDNSNLSKQGNGHVHMADAADDAASRPESPVQSGKEGNGAAGAATPGKSVGASLLRSPNSPSSKQNVSFVESLPVPVHVEESDSARAVRLLHLLNIFVQLKESTGVERATVSSILADDVDSGLLLNDLVLEVENQRQRVEELDGLAVGPLRNLVQELVLLSPEMLQLQRRLSSGTDLEQALQYCSDGVDNLWDLLTVYIDKLHSLELLIVEEIECCAPADESYNHQSSSSALDPATAAGSPLSKPVGIVVANGVDTSQPTMGIIQQLLGAAGQDQNSLLQQVEAMSPADLKDRLLIALSNDNNNIISASPDSTSGAGNGESRGVEDLLREISCAPASKEWEIDLYEMRFLKQIGQGSAGTTYLANWGGQQVAVKVASITEMGLEGWRTEVQALQKLHHPNIIRLLGSVYHPSPLTICLVLEYCKAGDLSNAIHQLTPRNFFFHVSTSIANGMNYLHNRGIIHRDIKPANVLLDGDFASGDFQVKVTDFGVATESSVERSNERTAETGTYRWMAPEVIRHESYSSLADVYSFAVLMWQLLTREDPFGPQSQIDAAMSVARDCVRPPFPTGTPVAIQKLIEACWSDDPTLRLPFDQISTSLKDIESKLTDAEKQWIEAPLGHSVYKQPKQRVSVSEILTPQLNVDHVKTPANQPIPARSGGKPEKRGGGFLGRFGRGSA
jgi:serine/threonine protein kinase